MTAEVVHLFEESWSDRIHRLALALKNVPGDPISRTPKERMAYRQLAGQVAQCLRDVE